VGWRSPSCTRTRRAGNGQSRNRTVSPSLKIYHNFKADTYRESPPSSLQLLVNILMEKAAHRQRHGSSSSRSGYLNSYPQMPFPPPGSWSGQAPGMRGPPPGPEYAGQYPSISHQIAATLPPIQPPAGQAPGGGPSDPHLFHSGGFPSFSGINGAPPGHEGGQGGQPSTYTSPMPSPPVGVGANDPNGQNQNQHAAGAVWRSQYAFANVHADAEAEMRHANGEGPQAIQGTSAHDLLVEQDSAAEDDDDSGDDDSVFESASEKSAE
jgi:hypothetical protein